MCIKFHVHLIACNLNAQNQKDETINRLQVPICPLAVDNMAFDAALRKCSRLQRNELAHLVAFFSQMKPIIE